MCSVTKARSTFPRRQSQHNGRKQPDGGQFDELVLGVGAGAHAKSEERTSIEPPASWVTIKDPSKTQAAKPQLVKRNDSLRATSAIKELSPVRVKMTGYQHQQ
jgi:hypothetical protein